MSEYDASSFYAIPVIYLKCPVGVETTIQVQVTNISQCNETAPPHDVTITAGNDYAIFHANGTKTQRGQTLSITSSKCENAKTFMFSVKLTADHPIVINARIVDALQNGMGKWMVGCGRRCYLPVHGPVVLLQRETCDTVCNRVHKP